MVRLLAQTLQYHSPCVTLTVPIKRLADANFAIAPPKQSISYGISFEVHSWTDVNFAVNMA